MPLELRELIIQARIDTAGAAEDRAENLRAADIKQLEAKIIETVMERLEERLATAHQR
jgi:Family of unknown function (DUF5908)